MRSIDSHALYLDLLADLGLTYGDDFSVLPWDSPRTAAAKSLASSFVKKYHGDAMTKEQQLVAYEKFCTVNPKCKTWQLNVVDLRDELLIGTQKKYLYQFFVPPERCTLVHSFGSILDHGGTGPGASIGSESGDFYTKLFDSNLSTTSLGLYRAYATYFGQLPLWNEAEINRKGSWGGPDVAAGNRLSFVPKDVNTARTICVEPNLNMFFQIGLGRIIEHRLRGFFHIDLAKQPSLNRSLAHRGSETLDLVTIDLSSASDSMSTRMIREMLPIEITQWLDILRSPRYSFNGEDGELNMVSTMGNGFTFPLQTALFSCVVASAFEVNSGVNRVDNSLSGNLFEHRVANWGVFGDDIICPTEIVGHVLRLLELLGFTINHGKTFTGNFPFRESCGGDFFKGHPVRGVYCKTLKTTQDCYSLINQLNLWSVNQGIPLVRTVGSLLRRVPRIAVPPWENADCGIWISERSIFELRPRNIRKGRYGSYLYRCFRVNPKCMTFDESKDIIHVPRGDKPRRYNPAGLYIAFLRGNIVNGKILVRPDQVRYTTKLAVAPNWENSLTVKNPFKGSFGGTGLNAPELINLISAW